MNFHFSAFLYILCSASPLKLWIIFSYVFWSALIRHSTSLIHSNDAEVPTFLCNQLCVGVAADGWDTAAAPAVAPAPVADVVPSVAPTGWE